MDLTKIGNLLRELRKEKGMTQREVAEKLSVMPKTVSKWETGNGFPDVSVLSDLAQILGVSEKVLLGGTLIQNTTEAGNLKRISFFVCPDCGSFMQGIGASEVTCCGKTVEPLKAVSADDAHIVNVSEIEDDFYVEFDHEMTKEHYISFVSYVGYDRVLTVRLYPEQEPAVRFPKMYRGKLVFSCNKHGLFEIKC